MGRVLARGLVDVALCSDLAASGTMQWGVLREQLSPLWPLLHLEQETILMLLAMGCCAAVVGRGTEILCASSQSVCDHDHL